jgi:lipoprotein-anchoring transpeptidase ErfK/SrfK
VDVGPHPYDLRTLRRLFLFAGVVAALIPGLARAEDPLPPQPPTVAPGVVVGGVDLSGMTREMAIAAVEAEFAHPLSFHFRKSTWRITPRKLSAKAFVGQAVTAALEAQPGAKVPLVVRINKWRIRTYVSMLDRDRSRAPRDTRLYLRNLRPRLTKPRNGWSVRQLVTRNAIGHALRLHTRQPIQLAVEPVRPRITQASYRSIIVIRRGSHTLSIYRRTAFVRRLGVAVGQPVFPTPIGRFAIVIKARNPWWNPPDSDWAEGLEPVPPGPGNPLGTRWMGLSASGVGIHGTPDAASIGYSASHGCIRMRIPDAEWLFERVSVGTPVFIVRA